MEDALWTHTSKEIRGGIPVRTKLTHCAVATEFSAEPIGSTGAGIALQNCPKVIQRTWFETPVSTSHDSQAVTKERSSATVFYTTVYILVSHRTRLPHQQQPPQGRGWGGRD